MRLSPHFLLAEFIRVPESEVPSGVIENLQRLCVTLLEPLRQSQGLPIIVHSGYRAPTHNAAVGGVPGSDHETGRAADFHVESSVEDAWEVNTFAAYHWLRTHRPHDIGQLILEDHRHALDRPSRLWIHAAIPSIKHPGPGDNNQLLVSFMPGSYNTFTEELGRFA
jgi:hypothetical protein